MSAGTGGSFSGGATSNGGAGGSFDGGGTSNGGAPATGGDMPMSTSAGTSSNAEAAPEGPITGSASAPDAGGCQIGGRPRQRGVFFGFGVLAGALLVLRRARYSSGT